MKLFTSFASLAASLALVSSVEAGYTLPSKDQCLNRFAHPGKDNRVTVHRHCLQYGKAHAHKQAGSSSSKSKRDGHRNLRPAHRRRAAEKPECPEDDNHVNLNVPILDDLVNVAVLGNINNDNTQQNRDQSSQGSSDGNCTNVNVPILSDLVNINIGGNINNNNSNGGGNTSNGQGGNSNGSKGSTTSQEKGNATATSKSGASTPKSTGTHDGGSDHPSFNVPVLDGLVNAGVLGGVNNNFNKQGNSKNSNSSSGHHGGANEPILDGLVNAGILGWVNNNFKRDQVNAPVLDGLVNAAVLGDVNNNM